LQSAFPKEKMTIALHRRSLEISVLLGLLFTASAWSRALDVTGKVVITRPTGHNSPTADLSANVVIWLTPTQKSSLPPAQKSIPQYMLVQKDKSFTPHLLVVPTGSSIDFPNLDPFFHNVFSLFNGKRFDLGLYEAHSRRTVLFDREGVSYIFCNIHPEMGAVVVTLNTSYYAVSKADGSFTIHSVAPGTYRMNVWAENAKNDALAALSRDIEIGPNSSRIDTVQINVTSEMPKGHKNKFGEDYPATAHDPY
jgi:plastocyanin